MYFYYDENNQKLSRLVKQERFTKLVSYLQSQTEKPTLRQLKTEFSENDFEKFLEQAIDFGLIIRNERRYQIGFPIYNDAQDGERLKKYRKDFDGLDCEGQQSFLAALIDGLSSEEVFFAVAEDLPMGVWDFAGNERMGFYSLSLAKETRSNLIQYFVDKKDVDYQPTNTIWEALIGDVDETYFFDQVEVILEKVTEGKKVRPTIFLQALQQQKLLSDKEPLQLLVPELREKQMPAADLAELFVPQRYRLLGLLLLEKPEQQLIFLKRFLNN